MQNAELKSNRFVQNDAGKPAGSQVTLWYGIIFSLVFTAIIYAAGQWLEGFRAVLLPDSGPSWYYWKLPEPTFWTRASAWGLYLAHQITIWYLIYYAQSRKTRYSAGLNRVNIWALGANALFILLHFIQTHLWYDGLAQDVSIWSSQVSVVILLVWVLLMENRRRGLFVGKPISFSKNIIDFARKNHGYYFAWATIYTFWYHPMETTPGHLLGFLYMFLLLLQGSLFFTRIHINRYWTLVQEFSVLVHGTIVAVYQGNGMWPMFFFGFAGMFVITQMHGIGLKAWAKWSIFAVYVVLALAIYSQRGWNKIYELASIPLIEYLSVFVLAGLFWLGLRAAGSIKKRNQQAVSTEV